MTEPLRILVVDDDPLVVRGTCRVLEGRQYQCFPAGTGLEALRVLAEVHPQLVLLDRELPDLEGLEVCRRIKADPALQDSFVIIASGAATSSEAKSLGMEAGADGYLTRPIENRELLASVEAYARLWRMGQTIRQKVGELEVQNVLLQTEIRRREDAERRREELEGELRANLALADRSRLALLSALEDQKLVEMRLRESEHKFSMAFLASPISMILTSVKSSFYREVNDAFVWTSGFSRAEVIGRTALEIGLFAHPEEWLALEEEVLRAGQVSGRPIQFRTKAGAHLDCLLSTVLIAFGGESFLLSAAMDITERQQVEREIRDLNASLERKVLERTTQLRSANEELEAFAYSISHDLQAPLRAVTGLSQAVLDDFAALLPPEGQDYLRNARDEALRMGVLIEDLLRLARLGQQGMSLQEVDLTAMARSILKLHEHQEPERHVQWVLAPHLWVQGDPILLRVLLENLLGNAWKFTAKVEAARIQVLQCPAEPGWVRFRIEDNGAGFDAAYAERIFTPFRRLHSPKEFPGTGIGLAIVRRIVLRHGATIATESSPGQGAAFTLAFPVQTPANGQ